MTNEGSEGSGGVRRPWLGCAGVVALVVALGLGFAMISTQINGSSASADDLEKECVSLVAEWAGVDAGQVSSSSVGTSKVALDFRGAYPGGEWACGGELGKKDPNQLMVYPGGMEATEAPEQIYPKG